MDDKQFNEINKKLDTISRLLALNIVGNKKFIEQVGMLSSAGLQPKEIAALLGKTPANVSVQLNRLRKRAKTVEERGEESDRQRDNGTSAN